MQTKIQIKQKYRILVLVAIILPFISSELVGAATSDFSIPAQIPELEEQIEVDISPAFPKPGEEVTISLSAFGTDLNSAGISWSVDGAIVKSGKGVKTLKIRASTVGTTNKISVTITPLNGRPITKELGIAAGTVDMIWEARTYTPPFYRGKAFYSPQESVVFVAMPNLGDPSGAINSSGAIYSWRQDAVAHADRSGSGINSFIYKGSVLMQPVVVEVEVESEAGLSAKNYIRLSPTNPVIGLYEESPLLGTLWNKELSSGFEFGESEERSLLAVPYFFGAKSQADTNLSYKWSINGSQIAVPLSQYGMTLRNTDKQSGLSVVGVSVGNAANFLEKAEARSVVNFAAPRKVFSF